MEQERKEMRLTTPDKSCSNAVPPDDVITPIKRTTELQSINLNTNGNLDSSFNSKTFPVLISNTNFAFDSVEAPAIMLSLNYRVVCQGR